MKEKNILTELLHNKGIFIDKTLNNHLSSKEFKTQFVTAVVFFAVYGCIIGINHSFIQALASTIKSLYYLFFLS